MWRVYDIPTLDNNRRLIDAFDSAIEDRIFRRFLSICETQGSVETSDHSAVWTFTSRSAREGIWISIEDECGIKFYRFMACFLEKIPCDRYAVSLYCHFFICTSTPSILRSLPNHRPCASDWNLWRPRICSLNRMEQRTDCTFPSPSFDLFTYIYRYTLSFSGFVSFLFASFLFW